MISDLDRTKLRKNDKNNIWNKIALKYFGKLNYKDSINIKSWWTRNTKNFRKILLESFKSKKKFPKISKYIIDINIEEWKILEEQITKSKRLRFKSGMTSFLNRKLQSQGVTCWLVCKYNWIKDTKGQKCFSPYWNGEYSCIDPACENQFKSIIKEQSCLKIEVTATEQIIHPNKLTRISRCCGESEKKRHYY